MIGYDERAQKIIPRLAKAWRQVDDKTVEFDLRDDVKFHNGDKFDADDVVATIKYLIDPNVPLRFKNAYDWVDKVEKTGPYQVRITAKQVQAGELINFAYRFYILDGKVLAKIDNKADYGRMGAIGTGPYKVVTLDQQKMVLTLRRLLRQERALWRAYQERHRHAADSRFTDPDRGIHDREYRSHPQSLGRYRTAARASAEHGRDADA